ncbi:hypothethical protein [Ralstonia solanacearum PSI07]|nr:hypothethical protein [Ralstonia solanacearum PSI07]
MVRRVAVMESAAMAVSDEHSTATKMHTRVLII